ncbi:hypothetical protein TOPH_02395 [Tolypocladium ophioglossoides CBS 100239]|uniref:Uncharacterized protein n=1 Tax=Tolypocladium ophioglossoides (strain CBS 100239) TaxID=1163406 RepID=A0A0L0NHM9_TOLOC|nr:hypothetical protein TOPH_02395 [Tolypocladium ophioglossoides CBS 100239]
MEHVEGSKAPKRVLVVVSPKSPHWHAAWDSSDELVAVAFALLQQTQLIPQDAQNDSSTVRLLAKERWDVRRFLVFDLFHKTYNADTAHQADQDDLPVISVFFGKKESISAAGRPMANKVNADIRAIHNSTGLGSRPPFEVDHADGKVPFYNNPRSPHIPTTRYELRLYMILLERQMTAIMMNETIPSLWKPTSHTAYINNAMFGYAVLLSLLGC